MTIQRDWRVATVPQSQIEGGDPHSLWRARLTVEPLERGFGVTLGNALRRVLLSSLQGTAITAVQIDGVLHAFSSIQGVREDVVDILQNLKHLPLRMHAEGPRRMILRATGPGPVAASQIDAPAEIEILNGDHVICTLDDGASIRMEFIVENGKGYVSAEFNRPEALPLGWIAAEALYSPVTRVAYKVEPVHQGQSLDYDKLVLSVETNGAVTPAEAVADAARVLRDQLQIFVIFERPDNAVAAVASEQALPFNPALLKRVYELELSIRTANSLKKENIVYVGDLIQKTDVEMLRIADFGRRSLNEVKSVLTSLGLSLGRDVPSWPPRHIGEASEYRKDDALSVAETAGDTIATPVPALPETKLVASSSDDGGMGLLWLEIASVCRDLAFQSDEMLRDARGLHADLVKFRDWAEHARSSGR